MGRLACLGNEQANLDYSMGLGPPPAATWM
jgi:hypothetical protein